MDVVTLGLRVDASGAIQDVRQFGDAADQAATKTTRLERATIALVGGFGAYKALQMARETFALADAYTNLHARLGLVTSGVENLAHVQRELFQVSNDTRTGVESNVALFASLARSTKALGLTQEQLVDITRTVAQSFIVSGASASETNAAVRQLSQALASGVLRGDEFNSIAENAPRLQQAVAASLGVTIGKLREMAAQGDITGRVITTALLKSGAAINAEFQQIPLTVAGSITQLQNAILAYVGAGDKASGASHTVAESIATVAQNLGTVVEVTEVAAALFAGRWLSSLAQSSAAAMDAASMVMSTATAQREAAAAATLQAEAQRAASASNIAALKAEQAQLIATRAAAKVDFSGATTRVKNASTAIEMTRIDPNVKDLVGGEALAQRELTAALAARTAAQQTLTASSQRLAATDAELIAASNALVAAEARVVEAETARSAVMIRTSLVTQAAATATAGLSRAMALLGGPIGVALIAAVAINAALDYYLDKSLKAAEQTDAQRAATDAALASAHARAAAERKVADALTETQRKAALLMEERATEIVKQRALNNAYMGTGAALAILTIQYDAQIQKLKDAKEHQGTELLTLNALTDALAKQKIKAVELATARQAAQDQASLTATNRAMVQGAIDADSLADATLDVARAQTEFATSTGAAMPIAAEAVMKAQVAYEHLQIAIDAANKVTAADVELAKKMVGATAGEIAAAQTQHDQTITAIANERAAKDATADRIAVEKELLRVRGEQAALHYDLTKQIDEMRAETDATRRQKDALGDSLFAQRELAITLAGEKAVRDAVNAATAKHITLTKEDAAAVRQAAEDLERAKQETNDLRDAMDDLNTALIAALGGGADSVERMLTAFEHLFQLLSAHNADWGKVAAGVAGLGAGYGIGSSTANTGAGVLGGAASGAMVGFEVAGPWGAAIGGLTGAAGGLLGASKAQEEAAKRLKEAGDAFKLTVKGYQASTETNPVAQQLNAIQSQYDALMKQNKELLDAGALSVTDYNHAFKDLIDTMVQLRAIVRENFFADIEKQLAAASGPAANYTYQVKELNKEWEDAIRAASLLYATQDDLNNINALYNLRLQQLKEAMEENTRQIDASLAIRSLYAQGLTAEGDAMALAEAQRKELADAVRNGWSAEELAALRAVQALEAQKAATEAAAEAIERHVASMAGLTARFLTLTGMTDEAARAAQAEAQRVEMNAALKAGASPDELALLNLVQLLERGQLVAQQELAKQSAILDAQSKTAQEALSVAKAQLDAAQQAVESLRTFGDSLKVGPLSALSPLDQLEAARSQMNAVFAKAQSGDAEAAKQFATTAAQYLQASRGYNASGPGYASDFTNVQQMTDTLATQYAGQVSLEQQMVDKLQAQIDLLTQQLAELQNANALTNATKEAVVAEIQKSTTAALAPNAAVLAQLDQLRSTLAGVGLDIVDAEHGTLVANQVALQTATQAQVDAVNAGAAQDRLSYLDQVRVLTLQKTSMDAGFAAQLAQAIQTYGAESAQVQQIIALQAKYDAGVAAQIAAIALVAPGVAELTAARDHSAAQTADTIAALNAIKATLSATGQAIIDKEQAALSANQIAVTNASLAEIAAVNAGASDARLAYLDQVRVLNLQKASTDAGFAAQLAQAVQTYGAESAQVQQIIALQAKYDAGVAAQIAAIQVVAPSTAELIASRDHSQEQNGKLIDQLNSLRDTLTGTSRDIVTQVRDSAVANMNLLNLATQNEITAINQGASTEQINALEQIRQLSLQKMSTDQGFAQQIVAMGTALGYDSQQVQEIIRLQQKYDAGVAAQIAELSRIREVVGRPVDRQPFIPADPGMLSATAATNDLLTRLVAKQDSAIAVLQDGLQRVVAAQDRMSTQIDANTTETRLGLERLSTTNGGFRVA